MNFACIIWRRTLYKMLLFVRSRTDSYHWIMLQDIYEKIGNVSELSILQSYEFPCIWSKMTSNNVSRIRFSLILSPIFNRSLTCESSSYYRHDYTYRKGNIYKNIFQKKLDPYLQMSLSNNRKCAVRSGN